MSKLLIWDFECPDQHVFEDLQAYADNAEIPCPRCGKGAKRMVSGTRLDPRMGLSNDFPTMADKWEKKTRQRARNDKLTDNPNLWMY
jgi:putative FmdB family regulatory protein